MNRAYDVAVVGLGAMGSAALYHLARRGARVVGFDRYRPPHRHGSSHGKTRVIREAYFEHPLYVPLVQRAYTLWHELAEDADRPLIDERGMLLVGPPEGPIIAGALRSAETYGLSHERLSATEMRSRFPMFRVDDEDAGVFEPRGGLLFPERCIEAHLDGARRGGATLRFEEAVTGWRVDGDGVVVEAAEGVVRAGRLIVAAGAWVGGLFPELDLPLTVVRQVLHWFEPVPWVKTDPEQWPVYGWDYSSGKLFYGFPARRGAVKVARHHGGQPTDPETVERRVDAREVSRMRGLLRRFLPDANGRWARSCVCLYTNTPDEHFILDRHPEYPQVWIASPCSGHGFKFSSAIGEWLADAATDQPARVDVSAFRLDRFAAYNERSVSRAR